MSGLLNREQLVQKLRQLNSSQQSIEGTAQWCLFYSKEAKTIVAVWDEEFVRLGAADKKLAQLYLANHLIQEGKKKGRDFGDEFGKVLPRAIKDIMRLADDKTRKSVGRLVEVWETRRVLGSALVKLLKDAMAKPKDPPAPKPHAPAPAKGDDTHHNKLQILGPLADIMSEVLTAHEKTNLHNAKIMQLKPNLHLNGSAPEVAVAKEVVSGAVLALQAETRARQRAAQELRNLLNKQEDAVRHLDIQLKQLQQQHQAALDNRMVVLESTAALNQPQGSMLPPPRPPAGGPIPGPRLPASQPPPGGMLPMGVVMNGGGMGGGMMQGGMMQGMPRPPGPGFPNPGMPGPMGMIPPDVMMANMGLPPEAIAALSSGAMGMQGPGAPMMIPQPQPPRMLPQHMLQPPNQLKPQPGGVPPAMPPPGAPPPGPGPQPGPAPPRPAPPGPAPPAATAAPSMQAILDMSAGGVDVADKQTAAMLAQALAALPEAERQRLAQGLAAAQGGPDGDNAHQAPTTTTTLDASAEPAGPTSAASHDDLMQDADFSRFILGEVQPEGGSQEVLPDQPAFTLDVSGAADKAGDDDDDYDPDNPL